MASPLQLLFNFMWFLIIAHVVMSWLINFSVLNLRQPLVAQLWDGLNRLLEPIYGICAARLYRPDVRPSLAMRQGLADV
jgi:YGGT family